MILAAAVNVTLAGIITTWQPARGSMVEELGPFPSGDLASGCGLLP
jgi:hypothetical protein